MTNERDKGRYFERVYDFPEDMVGLWPLEWHDVCDTVVERLKRISSSEIYKVMRHSEIKLVFDGYLNAMMHAGLAAKVGDAIVLFQKDIRDADLT